MAARFRKEGMNEVILAIREEIRKSGSQKRFALDMGTHPSNLAAMCRGRLLVTDRILNHLGFERVLVYRRKKQ